MPLGSFMPLGSWFDELTPYARVSTALIPFLVAILLRLLMGKNRFTGTVLSLATMWFAINVLLAPYASGMRREILNLPWRFR